MLGLTGQRVTAKPISDIRTSKPPMMANQSGVIGVTGDVGNAEGWAATVQSQPDRRRIRPSRKPCTQHTPCKTRRSPRYTVCRRSSAVLPGAKYDIRIYGAV